MPSKHNVTRGRNHTAEESKSHEKRKRKTLLNVTTNYSEDKFKGPGLKGMGWAVGSEEGRMDFLTSAEGSYGVGEC